MNCPECGTRKARRACPALSQLICPVCCATKRLKEIACPPDCPYLVSARQHPPAAQLRQQQQDLGHMVGLLRDFSEAQARLFLSIARFVTGYEAPDLHRLIDEDVEEAAAALAATYQTAAKGVIYDHSPHSLPAERLLRALKPFLSEICEKTKVTESDRAAVLRRLAEEIQRQRQETPGDPCAFLSFAERVLRDPAADRAGRPAEGQSAGDERPGPRLILP